MRQPEPIWPELFVDPMDRDRTCPECLGAGYVAYDGLVMKCPRCDGVRRTDAKIRNIR